MPEIFTDKVKAVQGYDEKGEILITILVSNNNLGLSTLVRLQACHSIILETEKQIRIKLR